MFERRRRAVEGREANEEKARLDPLVRDLYPAGARKRQRDQDWLETLTALVPPHIDVDPAQMLATDNFTALAETRHSVDALRGLALLR